MAEGSIYIDLELPDFTPQLPMADSKDKDKDSGINAFIQNLIKNNKIELKLLEDIVENGDKGNKTDSAMYDFIKNDGSYNTEKGKRRAKNEEYLTKRMVAADFFTKAGGYLKGIWENGKNLFTDILKFLLVFALFGPAFLDAIINFVISTVMMLVDALIAAIPSVVAAIVKWLPIIIEKIGGLLTKIIPIIADALPKLIEGLLKGAVKIIDALVKLLPIVIPALIKVLTVVIKAIATILPDIIKALVMGMSIIITELAKLFQDPAFQKAMIDAFIAIVKAVIDALPILLSAFFDLIFGFYSFLQSALAKIASLDIPIISDIAAFLTGYVAILMNVVFFLKEFFSNLFGLFSSDSAVKSQAKKWFEGIWNSIKDFFKMIGNFFVKAGEFAMEFLEIILMIIFFPLGQAYLIYKGWLKWGDKIKYFLLKVIPDYFMKAIDKILETISMLGTKIGNFFDVSTLKKSLMDTINKLFTSDTFKGIKKAFGGLFDWISDYVGGIVYKINHLGGGATLEEARIASGLAGELKVGSTEQVADLLSQGNALKSAGKTAELDALINSKLASNNEQVRNQGALLKALKDSLGTGEAQLTLQRQMVENLRTPGMTPQGITSGMRQKSE